MQPREAPAPRQAAELRQLGLGVPMFAIPLWCALFVAAYSTAILLLYPKFAQIREAAVIFDAVVARYEHLLPVLGHATEILTARQRADLVIPVRNVLFVMAVAWVCAAVAYGLTMHNSIARLAAFTIRRADAGEKMLRSEQPAIFGSLLFGYLAASSLYSLLSSDRIFFRRMGRLEVYSDAWAVVLMNFFLSFALLGALFLSVTAIFGFSRADVRAALVRRRHRKPD